MIIDAAKGEDKTECSVSDDHSIPLKVLLVQGVATSLDALSVGLTLSTYDMLLAFLACLIIGIITFGICFGGVLLGKRVGTKHQKKAGIAGGIILILIGIEIFITGII